MTDSTIKELSLKVSRTINAPAEAIYNAWLDPELLAKFMLPAEGMKPPKIKLDTQEGGRFSILMMVGENEIPHEGEYLVLNPYSQIRFTWESPFSIEGSTVTINLSKVDAGTKIDLTHIKFPNEESRSNHEGGWKNILNLLNNVTA